MLCFCFLELKDYLGSSLLLLYRKGLVIVGYLIDLGVKCKIIRIEY